MYSRPPIFSLLRPIALLAMVAVLLTACASAPPADDKLAAAKRAVASAEGAHADELAPLELRFAREKLAEAVAFANAGKNEEASWSAEQAVVSAQLARVKAEGTAARNKAVSLREQISNLERHIEALSPSGSR